MKLIFVFIDGFGMGGDDPHKNPLIVSRAENIKRIFRQHTVLPTDASLGVPGFPQSATGQTCIFTGVNAQAVLGRHLNGQPTKTLKDIITSYGLFKALMDKGLSITNSNVYRNEYLQKMLDPHDRKHRPSVTSVMTMAAGLTFRTAEDYRQGNGIYHDITGKILVESGYAGSTIPPAEAACRLVKISRNYDFTLFEHFMTDIIGHRMDMQQAVEEIEILDEFLGELLCRFDGKNETIVIASDHGNIEDVSVKTHTMNKVPTIVIGRGEELVKAGDIKTLLDIYPFVLRLAAW